jgi:predicted nucleic acid-binding Zn ribbon protein
LSVEPVGGVLERVLRDLGLGPALAGWRAVEAWPRVAGPRLARRARAVAFRDGTLHVEVEGSAWMHELGFLKRDLIERIHRDLGTDEVRDLRFSIHRGGNRR